MTSIAEQVAGLPGKSKEVRERREGDGTMLDNTVLVFTSDSANRQHTGGENWPFVLIGNLGGRLKTNQFLGYPLRERGGDAGLWGSHGAAPPSNPMINALYCTLLHATGRPRDAFNHAAGSRDDTRFYAALPELLRLISANAAVGLEGKRASEEVKKSRRSDADLAEHTIVDSFLNSRGAK